MTPGRCPIADRSLVTILPPNLHLTLRINVLSNSPHFSCCCFLCFGPTTWLRGSWFPVLAQLLSHIRLFVTTGIVACQASLSMGLFRQEYGSGLPFLFPGDLPDPRIKLMSTALVGRFLNTEPFGKPLSSLNKDQTCAWKWKPGILMTGSPRASLSSVLYETSLCDFNFTIVRTYHFKKKKGVNVLGNERERDVVRRQLCWCP